jgi:sialic acid synthase SpsE
MSYERDIRNASFLLRTLFAQHAFLHCNSTYPAPPEDVNLNYISRLRDMTNTVVGYSSHDGNIITPLASIAKGAQLVEFHITRSRSSPGTDHRASIELTELPKFVAQAQIVYTNLGNPRCRRAPETATMTFQPETECGSWPWHGYWYVRISLAWRDARGACYLIKKSNDR